MKDEFKRAMHPTKAYGCGRWSCAMCGPDRKERIALRRLARRRLRQQDRELFDYYWNDSRMPSAWRDSGGGEAEEAGSCQVPGCGTCVKLFEYMSMSAEPVALVSARRARTFNSATYAILGEDW